MDSMVLRQPRKGENNEKRPQALPTETGQEP